MPEKLAYPSKSVKQKIECGKNVVLSEVCIRYFIFERTGRESGHVLRHHDIRFATDFKDGVKTICRFRSLVNWHEWNDHSGVEAGEQAGLDIV